MSHSESRQQSHNARECWCGIDHSRERYTLVVASTIELARDVARRERLTRWKPVSCVEHMRGYGPEHRFILVGPWGDNQRFYDMLGELRRLEAKGATIERY